MENEKKIGERTQRQEALERLRVEVLEGKIYPALEEAGLPKHFWPRKVGDVFGGEWVFHAVDSVMKNQKVPMWHVTYIMRDPHTEEFCPYTIRYSCGAIAVVRVNGQYLITTQHRPTNDRWVVEFPKCFTERQGPSEEQYLEIQQKKFQWLVDVATKVEWKFLDFFHTDPGTDWTTTEVYSVDIEIDEEKLRKALKFAGKNKRQTRKTAMRYDLMSAEKIQQKIENGVLTSLLMREPWTIAMRNNFTPFKIVRVDN